MWELSQTEAFCLVGLWVWRESCKAWTEAQKSATKAREIAVSKEATEVQLAKMPTGSQLNQELKELRNHTGIWSLVHDWAVGRGQTAQAAETQATSPGRL